MKPLTALLLAAVAAAAILVGCGAQAAPPASPGSPSPVPSPSDGAATPAPTPTPRPERVAWERVSSFPTLPDAVVTDVVPTESGFVALGFDGRTGSTFWMSSDALTWAPIPSTPDLATAGMTALFALEDGRLMAVGRDTTDIEHQVAVVWFSGDGGTTWQRAAGGPALDGGQILDVVETDDGFVAVGGFPGADAAAVWTSIDGEAWSLVADDDGELEHAYIWAVTRGGPGFVAVGWRRNPEPDLAVWTSTDGAEWALAPDPEGGEGFQGNDVLQVDGTLVMVGDLVFGGAAAAWTSTDGLSWEPAESESFDGAVIFDVATTPNGLVAVGGHNEDDAAAWSSPDGRSWTLMESDAFTDAYLQSALATENGIIAVGALQEQIERTGSYVAEPMIWFGAREER